MSADAKPQDATPLPAGCANAQEALALFDALEPIGVDAMLGNWTGREFASGHPLDGALAAYGWYGKRFDTPEQVHPLLFAAGGRIRMLRPRWLLAGLPLLLRWPQLRQPMPARLVRMALPLAATRRSRGRLRMLQFRGRVSAALVYDEVPILDVFRRVDARTVLGLMDLKGLPQPFFFVLQRVQPPTA